MQNSKIIYDTLLSPWLDYEKIKIISRIKNEPNWVLELRLKAFEIFQKQDMPTFWPNLDKLDLDKINYFAKPKVDKEKNSWDKVPENIKETFDRLGIPEAEKEMLTGVWAQYDSETVYHSLSEEAQKQGVIFEDLDTAIQKYPELIKKYMSRSIPLGDHKFSSLHYSAFSSGTFLYIPKWVKLEEPLQSYFRMNIEAWGQFEHTIIVLEDEAEAHYIEGCSAPKYNNPSLHAWWVEIFVWKNAKMRYSSVENWSVNTYNLNTKRAIVQEGGYMEWVSGQLGSGVTMLYPCSILAWKNSKAEHLSFAIASTNQNQDNGAKVIHIWENTTSKVISKSLSKNAWINTYRGLVDIKKSAKSSKVLVDCDSLIIDEKSSSHSIPLIKCDNESSSVAHEASTSEISKEKLFYLTSKWIEESKAKSMIVNGFLSPIMTKLPMEYASELNVLIDMEFEWGF